jgi:hypothetical protein
MREREREKEMALPKSNIPTSGSPVPNPKSGSDYSLLIAK